MSKLVHLMCETCWSKMDEDLDYNMQLSDSHAGRKCCYCTKRVQWGMLVHRHPDAVPCKGIHEKVQ